MRREVRREVRREARREARREVRREVRHEHRYAHHDYREYRREARRAARREARREYRREMRRAERRHYRHHHRHRNNDGEVVAGAIIGFTLGAIIADAYNRQQDRYVPRSRVYNAPPSGGYYRTPAHTSYRPEPFTDEWYAYCDSKYRSFDPATGTFQPYNGPRKLCR